MTAIFIIMVIIAIAATVTGYIAGLLKGFSLRKYSTGRPLSPVPWMVCLTAAILLFLAALGNLAYSLYFITYSHEGLATVEKVLDFENESGDKRQHAYYSYTDNNGAKHMGKYEDNYFVTYDIGENLPIRFLDKSPHRSRLDTYEGHWELAVFLLAFSVVAFVMAVGLAWWRKKEQQWAMNRAAAELESR